MKFLLMSVLFVTASLTGFTAFAQNQCISVCRNDSGDRMNDRACQVAGELAGAQGCSRYYSLGCNWIQSTAIQHPGRCVNEGGNASFDNVCNIAGTIGAHRCLKYQSLGCTWYPGEVTCQ
ncbi:hypothetical protein AZI86_01670 [Bdellovibrio bacteriovorus]|uniref:Uncharacterized protein n=1 Tax=Bdellovibrio bacteriovorus TaxID=959 RepID=A0A150WNC1_BDEBC|nr:hypothetical protein [Bdellovibrio bacteriovorus]KYG65807.1 hypothetical protein AZI86_01670 [Bdellovibrio bacteriovorus]